MNNILLKTEIRHNEGSSVDPNNTNPNKFYINNIDNSNDNGTTNINYLKDPGMTDGTEGPTVSPIPGNTYFNETN